jgi:hypothetical protein
MRMQGSRLLNCNKKKLSRTFLGLKFSETQPKLDLKAIKFVVNEKIL